MSGEPAPNLPIRTAATRLQRDIGAGLARTEPVREVIREIVTRTPLSGGVPASAKAWISQLAELARQLDEDEIGRRHWHHAKLYAALIEALGALGDAHPSGGLERLQPRR
ncbi:hypothetical protein [Nonomuraea sp. NPDC046570]|uniref:hypothetical protein n=1 Tax=Nonomuraea sp. NPDC046570 TaxID=3155255 RepID=UPI0033F2DFB0